MKVAWGADKFEAQLEAARDGLRGLEKNIRKILGRDVAEGENGTVTINARLSQKRPLQEDRRRPSNDFPNNGVTAKRRWQQSGNNAEPKTVFSRLSARVPSTADDSGDEEDGTSKPAVSSRVIVTPREVPSRQEVIRRESTDERSKQRNRRMFGALLGTLQKFRQEETKLKAKEDKKAEIEARVEEAKRKEREELKKERQQLFLHRKHQLAQVKALEAKVARSKAHEEWRNAQIPLLNFIKTKTEPRIFYLPRVSTPETDALLQNTAKEIKAEIDAREKELLYDLEMIQTRSGKDQEKDDNISTTEKDEKSLPNVDKDGDVIMNELKEDDKDGYREEDRYEHIEEDADDEKEFFQIGNGRKEVESKKEMATDRTFNKDQELNDIKSKNCDKTHKELNQASKEGSLEKDIDVFVGIENYSENTIDEMSRVNKEYQHQDYKRREGNNDSSRNELIEELRKVYEDENSVQSQENNLQMNQNFNSDVCVKTEENEEDIQKLEIIFQNIEDQLMYATQVENIRKSGEINDN